MIDPLKQYMGKVTYTYDPGMELTFGTLLVGAIVITSVYAIGRTIYEKWINPPLIVEETPAVIPYHTAYRIAEQFARDRLLAHAPTEILVLPRNPDGTIAAPEQGNAGARTVDMQGRVHSGLHRRPSARGVAKVVVAEALA